GGFGMAYDQIFDNVGTNARPPQATSTIDSVVKDECCYLANGGIKPNSLPAALTPADARAATSSWLPNQKVGYAINWNLGVQHVFAKNYAFEARYVGTRGAHLIFQQQLNRYAVVTPTHNLPTYLQAPSQATLDGLGLTLTQLNAEADPSKSTLINPFLTAGFPAAVTAYVPRGNSMYHGLAMELTRRFASHLTFKGAYTWSHLMDDSTAEVNSTTLSPRRPQDFNNIRSEWASSLLDHRQRLSFNWIYETPWFQSDKNWVKRNVLGNYQIAGVYTVESPEYATPQSAADANLNADPATDRVIINPAGTPGLSSDVTALKNSRGDTVAYLAVNPNAQYIRAQKGAFPTSGRNILPMRGINNWDFNIAKNVTFTERWRLQVRADFFNGFNHPQYIPGRVNNILATSHAGQTNYLTPGNPLFGAWDQVYTSNPRNIQIGARLSF
ncbi:MAG TPA: carboxypeptidase regulatory-like domain-containing protein, partial [Bryobacteraceae bacterium]